MRSDEPSDQGAARLRAEIAQYRAIIDAMTEGVVVQDDDGSIVDCNRAAEEILGLTADQMTGRTSIDPRWRAIHEDGAPFPGEAHPAMVTLRTGEPCRQVVMGVYKPGGELTWIEINSHLIPGPEGRRRVFTTFREITAYKRALGELQAADDRLRHALRAAKMATWEWELENGRSSWSELGDELVGIPPGSYDGRIETFLAHVHPEDRPRLVEVMDAALADGPAPDEHHARFRTLAERWIDSHARVFRDADGRPVRLAGVMIDVTEARRLEAEIRHAQRLDALGRLAGGIAHDFNNLLTAIRSAALLAGRPGRDPAPELALIRDAADRAAHLTRQLLTFARRQAVGLTTVDLGALVRELAPLLASLVGERIDLAFDVAPGAWTVLADQGQLEQVVVNLVVNARDAIAETGRVRIEVRPAGEEVALVVADEGAGMSPEVLEHAFDPFFTTKELGTGLGLPTSYAIVHQHGGRITIDSAVGRGTRVEVHLPLVAAPAPVVARAAPSPSPPRVATLLLVEDDPMVRLVAERILVEHGHRVLVAADGEEGLALARAHLAALDLVLTDAVMPKLGGVALARALRELRPELPVLLMSGYQPDERVADPDQPILEKPYAPDDLLRRVAELLERRAA